MADNSMTSQERGLINQETEQSMVEGILGLRLREKSPSTKNQIAGAGGPWVPAQTVIKELEDEMGWQHFLPRSNVSGVQSPSGALLNALSVVTMRFTKIAPTEIEDIVGFKGSGPAVLTVRIHVPQDFTYTPDGMAALRRTYILSRRPHVVLLRRSLPGTPATHPNAMQSSDLELSLQRLAISDHERPEQEERATKRKRTS
ncbi:hypothetical protein MMC22_002748 [Lobaria immixta]|nr:hypothetical protein [Lobaria immixta]